MFRVLIYVAITFGLIFSYIKYMENRGIYYPIKQIDSTPASINLPFEDVYINTADNLRINAWFIPHPQAKYTLLLCHGNAGNISHRLEKISLLHRIGINIFILDYRGYGRSQGRPSEEGLYIDAQAAYAYLVDKRDIKPEQIILYGESIGSAVVIHLGSGVKVGALILEGAFSTGKDMAKRIYPFLPTFLFSNKFDCLTRIKQVNAPTLFIHSQNDEIVPIALVRKLYAVSPEPKQFVEIMGGHNTAFLDSQESYISSIAAFIENFKNP